MNTSHIFDIMLKKVTYLGCPMATAYRLASTHGCLHEPIETSHGHEEAICVVNTERRPKLQMQ